MKTRSYALLARNSLLAGFMVSSSVGCLVTADPEFTGLEQTRPLLIESGLSPTRSITEYVPEASVWPPINFTALLLSEDAGEDVQVILALNYGTTSTAEGPAEQYPDNEDLTASTLTAGPRAVTLSWTPDDKKITRSCNTLTMYATHATLNTTNKRKCPKSENDVSYLSWFVVLCSDGLGNCNYDDCPGAKKEELKYCENYEDVQ
jgi:hypothetical protein